MEPKKKIKTEINNKDNSFKTTVVKLKRSKEKIIQNCDIYIGRRCNRGGWNLSQSKWANPFTIKNCGSIEIAIEKYRNYILQNKKLLESLPELKGKILGCWCKPNKCHGDVLIELIENFTKK